MANIAIFRINYKSDFILTLNSDAGWATPFCIKFWTGAPSQAYFVGFDGTTYTHCAPVDGEPTKLLVQFDDHHLPIGDLKFQIAYHFTVDDFPTSMEDEVINQASVIIEVDGEPAQVMLDLNGETAPEIQFSLPAYANEAQRIANEQARIASEQQRIANEEARIAAETVRQQNEEQRIQHEEERVSDFARLKRESEAATTDANTAATLANEEAALAADKATLAQAAATLADEKAALAADKAALAQAAATLANEKAALAQQKAAYAQAQGDYANAQGDYAKEQGDYANEQGDYAKEQGTIAEEDHVRAESDHTRAESDHATAANDHTQAASDHTRAEVDHSTASTDHTTATNDHTQAVTDHATATSDHTQAGNDHTRAESDHTRAESDHAAVEVYVDSLGAFDISAYHATGGVLAKYADLTAALGTNGANIPDTLRKGGISVKFVQSSDNKYVQYRCMLSGSFTDAQFTNVANWQGVDEEPTSNSKNLVESGGVNSKIVDLNIKTGVALTAYSGLYVTNVNEGSTANATNANDSYLVRINGNVRFKVSGISPLYAAAENVQCYSTLPAQYWNFVGKATYDSATDTYLTPAGTKFLLININKQQDQQNGYLIEDNELLAEKEQINKNSQNISINSQKINDIILSEGIKLDTYCGRRVTNVVQGATDPATNEINGYLIKIDGGITIKILNVVPKWQEGYHVGVACYSSSYPQYNTFVGNATYVNDNVYTTVAGTKYILITVDTQNDKGGLIVGTDTNSIGYQPNLEVKKVLVIPIFGQSNAVGTHATPAITTMAKYNNIVDKYNKVLREAKSDIYGVCESPCSATGEYLVNLLNIQNSKETTVSIPLFAWGGAPITSFIKGSELYNQCIAYIGGLSTLYPLAEINCPAFCYLQGESDISSNNNYKNLLSQLQVDFDADVRAITEQTDIVKCCVFNLSWLPYGRNNNSFDATFMRICTAQMELVRDNANFICSTPTYRIKYVDTDKLHVANTGEKVLGYFQSLSLYQHIKGNTNKAKGLYPSSISVDGNDIIITLNVPYPPIKNNTSFITGVTNFGFTVINSEDTNILQSAEISDTNGEITLHCSSSPVGAKLRYGCIGTTDNGFTDGPRGTISDSQGLTFVNEVLSVIYPLDNYLQMFEYLLS